MSQTRKPRPRRDHIIPILGAVPVCLSVWGVPGLDWSPNVTGDGLASPPVEGHAESPGRCTRPRLQRVQGRSTDLASVYEWVPWLSFGGGLM